MRSSTWRALGNTYVVVETDGDPLEPDGAATHSAGTDGVLEVLAATPGRIEIAIWNPDGSRAELSGNGTRIAAAWLAARTGDAEIDVAVGDRVVHTRVLEDGLLEQDLGDVTIGPVETVDGISLVPVSVGNPHAVVLGDPTLIGELGPRLETHPRFPERTNVQVARIEAPGEVTARVWERGVGETESSGTSAVAVAAATHGEGEVLVHFPGGDLRVRLVDGRAVLTGPVEKLRVPRQVLVYLYRRAETGIEVLLLRRTERWGGFWQGVTGAPEWDESDEAGAVREVFEETGLDVSESLRAIGARHELGIAEFEDPAEWTRLYGRGVATVPEEVYAGEVPDGSSPVLAPLEHDAYRWCEVGEALALLRYDANRDALRAVIGFLETDAPA
jgi:diaminopimelate epimerase